jgi:hypothetical protein
LDSDVIAQHDPDTAKNTLDLDQDAIILNFNTVEQDKADLDMENMPLCIGFTPAAYIEELDEDNEDLQDPFEEGEDDVEELLVQGMEDMLNMGLENSDLEDDVMEDMVDVWEAMDEMIIQEAAGESLL